MAEHTNAFPFRRVAVIGCPGGGKSTFSRVLRDKTGLPLYHLDNINWRPDRTTIPKEEFHARQRAIIETDRWIIDGNYANTMEWRVAACDLVIFLDYPVEVCLAGVRARKGQAHSDIPWVEYGDDADFLDFIRQFEVQSKPRILALLAKYPDKTVVTFGSREESEVYLQALNPQES